MIFEIRNYHIKPEMLEAYKEWAQVHAIPYLSQNLDAVGFWAIATQESEFLGEPDPLGPANIVWMVKWTDRKQREEILPAVLRNPAWKEIHARIPGGDSVYLRAEIKLLESLV